MKLILLDKRIFDDIDRDRIKRFSPPDTLVLLVKFHLIDGEMVRIITL
jgi:hypothetical protein